MRLVLVLNMLSSLNKDIIIIIIIKYMYSDRVGPKFVATLVRALPLVVKVFSVRVRNLSFGCAGCLPLIIFHIIRPNVLSWVAYNS